MLDLTIVLAQRISLRLGARVVFVCAFLAAMSAIVTVGAEEPKARSPITLEGIKAIPAPKPEQPLERVQSETGARKEPGDRRPDDTLYGASDEIESLRIGWHFNDTGTAFRKAIDRDVPLVLVVHADWCEHCWKLIDALTCPSVNRFAGSAVFAIGSYETDKTASAIASSLGIEAYPTITVLYPGAHSNMLLEAGRINGPFPGDKLAKHLTVVQSDYNGKRRDDLVGEKRSWVQSYAEWKLKPEKSALFVWKLSRSSQPAWCVE